MLNDWIAAWRAAMRQSEAFCGDDIEELESHLREEIAKLISAGLSEEEAFFVARRRLGDGTKLADEFGKINGKAMWARRVQWMLAGCLLVPLVSTAITALAGLCTSVQAAMGCQSWSIFVVYAAGSVLSTMATVMAAVVVAGDKGVWFWRAINRAHAAAQSAAGLAMIMAGAIMIVATERVLTVAPHYALAKLMPLGEMGRFALDANIFSLVQSLIVPLVILATILWIDRRSTVLAGK